MASGWDSASKLAEKSSSAGNNYVKLENDGDRVIGAFVGEPYAEEIYFNEQTRRSELFTPAHAAEGKKPQAKFLINFWLISLNGEQVQPSMKIYQCNAKTFAQVVKFKTKYGLDKYYAEIERKGDKGDPKTIYTVLPDDPIPDTTRSTLAKAAAAHQDLVARGVEVPEGLPKLFNFDRSTRSDESGAAPQASTSRAQHVDHGEATAAKNEIRDRLKARPRGDVDRFLQAFGLSAIKDLRAEQIDQAFEFIASLERPANNDPFAD